jgi:hypothetical protein
MLIFFSFCFLYSCVDADDVNAGVRYFTRDFAQEIIQNPSLRYEISAHNIIFVPATARAEGLRIYGGVTPFETMFSDNSLGANFIEYTNYNIILLTERIDGIHYVRDFVILEKQHPETHLSAGAVEVNGEYFDWELIVVVNRHWHLPRRPYTDDISYAFKIDVSTKRIVPYPFETIRLFSEV